MLIASEPVPSGGVAGPVTKEYVPVLLVGSKLQGPLGAMSPAPTTTVVVTLAPAAVADASTPAAAPPPTRPAAAMIATRRCTRLVTE